MLWQLICYLLLWSAHGTAGALLFHHKCIARFIFISNPTFKMCKLIQSFAKPLHVSIKLLHAVFTHKCTGAFRSPTIFYPLYLSLSATEELLGIL